MAVALASLRRTDPALEALLEELRAPLLRLALKKTQGNLADAEDLTQDTLLKAWRAWPTLRNPAVALAWAQKILRNLFADHMEDLAAEVEALGERIYLTDEDL